MKRLAAACACCVMLASLCACSGTTIYSDRRELEDLELVRAVGIDFDGAMITITADTGVGIGESAPKIYRQKGPDLAAAIDLLKNEPVGKNTYFAHTEHIVISERAAVERLGGILDYVERSPDMRLNISLFIARGCSAQELIEGAAGEHSSACGMLDCLKEGVQRTFEGRVCTCGEAAASLAESGRALIMAVESVPTGDLSEGAAKRAIAPAGFAVVEDGAFAGFMAPEEVRGAVIFIGAAKSGSVTVGSGGESVSLGITASRAAARPVFEGGELIAAEIIIKTEANVAGAADGADVSSKAGRERIEESLAASQEAAVRAALEGAQRAGSDYLGLGRKLELRAPYRYRAAAASGWDGIFPRLELRYRSTASVKRTYDVADAAA